MLRRAACLALTTVVLAAAPPALAAKTPALRAGAGRADITPPTGYALGGWTRADRIGYGVHTRLYTSALVLQRGPKKVALVAADLFMIPGGIIKEVGDRLAARGFSEGNIVLSVSHTHSGPSRFANFDTLNTLAPSADTIDRPDTFVGLIQPGPPDAQLYTFLVERIALAIRRADGDRAPAVAAWGIEHLRGVTKNRSLEAHLANHGVLRDYGQGRVEEDPGGYEHTIDSEVRVLRVDRLGKRVRRCHGRGARRRCVRRRARIPLGGWSSFANHGTVNPSEFPVYTRDHHGAATHYFEREVRRLGRVPASRPVLNVYGNSNEGDQSAGLDGQGPVIAERVGRAEAEAMLRAWRSAGRRLATRPAFEVRWTRVCFCGQQTSAGPVASSPQPGIPFLTGSEEERGPLFDLTREPLEGNRSAVGYESQGHKIGIPVPEDSYPRAVPLFVVRVGDRLILSLPGEPTVELGRRAVDAALKAGAGMGVSGAMVAGLTNEFIQYLTTPEEYDRQHYEGGSTIFGPASPVLLVEQLAELTRRMANGQDAQAPYPFDPRNGVKPDGRPFGDGAAGGRIVEQPAAAVGPGGHARLGWEGGERGLDRRLDQPFVIVERRIGARWARADDDLGLNVVWTIDGRRYAARWQVPSAARAGSYRIVIAANRYRLESRPFTVDRGLAPNEPPQDDPIAPFTPYTEG
jgi:neutral ceramidase